MSRPRLPVFRPEKQSPESIVNGIRAVAEAAGPVKATFTLMHGGVTYGSFGPQEIVKDCEFCFDAQTGRRWLSLPRVPCRVPEPVAEQALDQVERLLKARGLW